MSDKERIEGYIKASFGGGSPSRRGRSVRDGYARGWGLQFGKIAEQVSTDPLYLDAVAASGGRSVVSEHNRMNLFLIIGAYLSSLSPGHIVEYGTYRGGNAIFMAYVAKRLLPDIRVYALDTFGGMPATDSDIDAHSAGDFAGVDLAELTEHANSLGLNNLVFVKGLFEQTAPDVLREAKRVSLAHIDCDIYSAVKYAYLASKPYMTEGGYYVFDDATVSSCLGATEAVEEVVVQADGKFSEQIYPQFVFRHFRESGLRPAIARMFRSYAASLCRASNE